MRLLTALLLLLALLPGLAAAETLRRRATCSNTRSWRRVMRFTGRPSHQGN